MTVLETSQAEEMETTASAVSWSAIVAGALAAVAATLILLILGSGLGLSLISPWPNGGISSTTFVVSGVIWLIVVQWLSAALGGYLTGRLRSAWTRVHDDERFFRDTAHGLLSWALATALVVSVLSAGVSSIVSGGAREAAATEKAANGAWSPSDYYVDLMFRSRAGSSAATAPEVAAASVIELRNEASRILVAGFAVGSVSAEDRNYLAYLVSTRTGMPSPEADKRVDDVMLRLEQAKTQFTQTANTARKVAMTTSLLTALALIVGAFTACVAAAIGGRSRGQD